jgi:hypothetical protein
MHGSRSKIPSIKSCQAAMHGGINSGVKGLILRNVKLHLYDTLIRSTVTGASVTWVLKEHVINKVINWWHSKEKLWGRYMVLQEQIMVIGGLKHTNKLIIQGVYKRMLRFKKLTINLFLTLHCLRRNHLSSQQLPMQQTNSWRGTRNARNMYSCKNKAKKLTKSDKLVIYIYFI